MSSPLAPPDLEPVKVCFAELHAQQSQLEQTLEESFRDLASLHSDLGHFHEELLAQSGALERDRQDLEETRRVAQHEFEQERTSQLAALKQQVDEAQAELVQLRQQSDEAAAAREQAFERQRDELQQERDRFERECEAARTEAAALAATVARLSQSEREEDQVASELCETRAQLADTTQDAGAKREQIKGLVQERDDLEAELDTVRARAAELSDTLDQMKRESVEERAEWSAELKQMRRVLERQAELLTSGPPQRVAVAPTPTAVTVASTCAAATTQTVADPVLGTVMAQFEQIRKERAQRRLKREKESI